MIGGRLKFKQPLGKTQQVIPQKKETTILGKRSKNFFTFDPVVDSGPKLQQPSLPENEEEIKQTKEAEKVEYMTQPIEKGDGKIITSGKTVHGFETEFPKQIAIGDSIILMVETDDGKFEEKERRRVNMVLSARSCGLEDAFTEDLI